MRPKTSLFLLLILGSCQCNNKKATWIEAYNRDETPLEGYIDIFKFDGKDYTILVAHIICDPTEDEEDDKDEDEDEDEEPKDPFCHQVYLEPGKYKLNFYDEIKHESHTQYMTIQ
jgi:hypothetical protein